MHNYPCHPAFCRVALFFECMKELFRLVLLFRQGKGFSYAAIVSYYLV